MGIEPTWDFVEPHAGFEDQERHQAALHLRTPSREPQSGPRGCPEASALVRAQPLQGLGFAAPRRLTAVSCSAFMGDWAARFNSIMVEPSVVFGLDNTG